MISDIRHNLNMSQREFAQRFEIPVRTLQQWEQGRSTPPEYIEKLLKKVVGEKHFELLKINIPQKSCWKICIENPFLNCDRIYPIQQKKVKELINDIAKNRNVKSIVIFGSSVTEKCHMGSDVDLYCEMEKDEMPVTGTHLFEYDFWNNYSADNRIINEINKKGVVVYERDGKSVR